MSAPLLTSTDFLNQMITQARLLDPSISAEVGTPEYKIFSSVAQSLAANQVSMTGLTNAFNINSKVGSNLDQFIANFGMQRQGATAAQGYVIFSCPTPATANIVVPQNTILQASNVNPNTPTTVQFATSAVGTIALGETSSAPVPVQAITTGSSTNVAAGTLNQFVGTLPAGVSSVTNPQAIGGGLDPEDDDIFQSRFQNTWARNLSGTTASYLAVALAGAFTTKAVCIGHQSTYIEYIQVPDADDAGYRNGIEQSVDGIVSSTVSSGGQGLWTTALSDIPYAKSIFTTLPTFVSDNGSGTYYYQAGVDYIFNAPPLLQGDALREYVTTTPTAQSGKAIIGATEIACEDPIGFPSAGTILVLDSYNNFITITYTSIGQDNTFPDYYYFDGITVLTANAGNTVAGNPIYLVPDNVNTRPNFTFTNVSSVLDTATNTYSTLFDATTGQWVTNSATVNPTDTLVTVQALTPGQVVQSEFKYVSSASRNNPDANITNCIDVYVNGANPQQTSCVLLPPSYSATSLAAQFNSNPSSAFYVENYRRDGEPTRRPNVLNYWTPLFNPPLLSLPSSITGPDGSTFFLGVHYWLVHEVDDLVNSTRSRDGIEWSYQLWGDNQTTAPNATQAYVPAGLQSSTIMNYGILRLPVSVNNYSNDANIINMQATYETSRPATTDVLAHRAKIRYFKFDITLMYASTSLATVVQSAIATALNTYLNNQYFGSIIQLSSVLEQIASVSGVQNVRWSNDLPSPPNQIRVIETDVDGNPLAGAKASRYAPYNNSTSASFTLEISGSNFGPTDGFILSWDTGEGETLATSLIGYDATAATIETAINNAFAISVAPYQGGVTVSSTPLYQSSDPNNPYIQYLVTYATAPTTVASGSNGVNVSTFTGSGTLDVASTAGYDSAGVIRVVTSTGIADINYTGLTATSFTGCTTASTGVASGVLSTGAAVTPPEPVLPTVLNNFTQGTYLYNEDFFLLDDVLPSLPTGQVAGDTLPGLIARTRAENTFYRPGIG